MPVAMAQAPVAFLRIPVVGHVYRLPIFGGEGSVFETVVCVLVAIAGYGVPVAVEGDGLAYGRLGMRACV